MALFGPSIKHDFEKEIQENNRHVGAGQVNRAPENGDFVKAGEQIATEQMKSQAEQAQELAEYQKRSEAEAKRMQEEWAHRESDRDHTDDVDTRTGQANINGQALPQDPNLTADGQSQAAPTSQQSQSAPTPAGVRGQAAQAPQGQGPQAQTPQAPQQAAPVVPAGTFKAKASSFFDADAKDGFWDTFETKLKDGLSGNTPEAIAENMFWAMLTGWLDMLAAYLKHKRQDQKRQDKEYKDRVAEHDTKTMGVQQLDKNMALWAVLGNHPDMMQYAGRPVGKEARKAALNVLKKDKNANAAFRTIMSQMLGREVLPNELNDMVSSGLNMITNGNSVKELHGLALNNPKIKAAINTSALGQQVNYIHGQQAVHMANVRQNQANRVVLNNVRNNPRAPTPNRTYTQDRSRSAA